MKISILRYILVLAVLAGASLACNFPGEGSSRPPTAAPLGDEEAQQLEEQLEATLASAGESGEKTIQVTQDDLNAYLSREVAGQDPQIITNPVVVLTGTGQMEVYGTVSQSGLSVDTKMVLEPRVDGQGNTSMDVVSFDIGPFPAPDSLKNQAETTINEALSDYLAESSDQFRVTSITISEGLMTISGVTQPQP